MNTQITEQIVEVPLKKIIYNRYQPRTSMDQAELQSLADSIQRNTMMQKPTARPQPDGCYELAFGHRRFEAYKILAAKDAAFKTMPLIVRELSDQQLFEFAWEENREREDINPVDEGQAYANYMQVFNATSKQAGEYFGVSEETIRQKQRYSKLPPQIQEDMRNGKVNENTARALLSMQKVATDKVLIETVKQIAKDRDEATPEEVIQGVLEDLDGVVEMWESYQAGEPRGGSHGWPLTMKKFPNELLPAMSEQAVGANEQHIEHLVNPPSCTSCQFYTKLRGTHYCGLSICFQRKTVAWKRQLVEKASKQTGIPVYSEEDGISRQLSWQDKSLFTKKHKGLRLIPGRGYQDFPNLNDDEVLVVATGEALDLVYVSKNSGNGSSSGSGNKGKKTEAEKAKMRRMKVYRRVRRDLMWEFTGIAKSIFDGVPYEALLKINRWHHVLIDDQPPTKVIVADNAKVDDHKTEYQRRMLVWRLIMNDSSHYRESSMADMIKDFEKRAKEWSVKIPKSLIKQAAEWDAEIKAAGERKPQ